MSFSSRGFNQDAGRAKKATNRGPVFTRDRGKPAHVLISIEEYERLTGRFRNIADALALPESMENEFNPPTGEIGLKPADFS
ncbi:MAG TPA: prevent-host-death protein [Methylococcaceae bacterium]|nr:prevent-host-death protein [Methylococcaceae bacterium]